MDGLASPAAQALTADRRERLSRALVASAWVAALLLPLVGVCALLLRRQLDPAWDGEEQHEVQPRAVPGGLELTSQEQRAEADEREKQSRHPRARDQRA